MEENTTDYACLQHKECQTNCQRRTNFNGPKWFDGWLEGQPDSLTDCPVYKAPKVSLIDSLL